MNLNTAALTFFSSPAGVQRHQVYIRFLGEQQHGTVPDLHRSPRRRQQGRRFRQHKRPPGPDVRTDHRDHPVLRGDVNYSPHVRQND